MLKDKLDIKYDARQQGYLYQVEAVEAVKDLPYAAIFHEQGLGKTKIGIDLALEWLRTKQIDSVLVVTKRGLIENWRDEILAHTFVAPRILDQDRSATFFSLNSPARIYLTHYEAVRSNERRLALFLKTRRIAAILDESHKIKNPDAEVTKSLNRLADGFVRRIIMTGTPVANRPFDIWSQIYFLDKGKALGTDFAAFKKGLDLSNDLWEDHRKRQHFEESLSRVYANIAPFTVRETKSSAGIDLPQKRIENIFVDPEKRQLELYESYRVQLSAEVFRDGRLIEDNAEELLKRLLRLVQLASNPHLVDRAYSGVPGKLPKLLALLNEAIGGGSKAIVWTNFVENTVWLASELGRFAPVIVHGGLSQEERSSALSTFKLNGECKVLVATPGAAKEGLTLTMANHAIFYDRSFSLDDYLQAQDRIHRISQTQTCFIWNILCRDTVDGWVDSLLAAKRLAAQLAQSDISAEEYQRLADYDFGRIVREILGIGGGGG